MTSTNVQPTVATGAAEIAERLREYVGEQLGTSTVRFDGFRRHTEGFSWETYSVGATWVLDGESHSRGLVMHRVPASGLLEPYDAQRQFDLLRALRPVDGIPVAEPLWCDGDGTALGRPMYVVDKVAGDAPTPWTVREHFADDEVRRDVGRQFAAIGAAMHGVGREILPEGLIGADASDPVEAIIEHWESQYRRNRFDAFPAADYVFAWLRRNRSMGSGRVGLVHGDYRVGNFIVRDGRLVAMLDWETAHVGDPVEDLAYATAKGLRGGNFGYASGLVPLDEFIAAYEEAAGWTVPRSAIQYWWVMITAAAIAQWLTAVRHFESGRSHDVRHAALGYQLAYQLKEAFSIIEAVRTGQPPWPAA